MNTLAADQYEHLTFEGVQTFTIARHPSHIELIRLSVFADQQGKGYGSAAIKKLQAERKPIRLIPVADDAGLKYLAQERLEMFYRKHGFRFMHHQSDWMEWKP